MYSGRVGGVITPPDKQESDKRPKLESLKVDRTARVAIWGDASSATEAWLVLHGYGMTAQGILHWFGDARRPDRLLVAPEGLSRFYQNARGLRTVGASWMTREDRENEILDQIAYLNQVVERWIGSLPLQVHGFSQGVATACRWAAASKVPIKRLVCWGSPTPQDVSSDELKLALGGEPLHLAIGETDRYFSPQKVAEDAAKRESEGLEVKVTRFQGGHEVDREVLVTFSS